MTFRGRLSGARSGRRDPGDRTACALTCSASGGAAPDAPDRHRRGRRRARNRSEEGPGCRRRGGSFECRHSTRVQLPTTLWSAARARAPVIAQEISRGTSPDVSARSGGFTRSLGSAPDSGCSSPDSGHNHAAAGRSRSIAVPGWSASNRPGQSAGDSSPLTTLATASALPGPLTSR